MPKNPNFAKDHLTVFSSTYGPHSGVRVKHDAVNALSIIELLSAYFTGLAVPINFYFGTNTNFGIEIRNNMWYFKVNGKYAAHLDEYGNLTLKGGIKTGGQSWVNP